jgi:hypothetical protein
MLVGGRIGEKSRDRVSEEADSEATVNEPDPGVPVSPWSPTNDSITNSSNFLDLH